MNLYDQIQTHFHLPNAYEDWTNYRNTLTNYLITETNQLSLPLSFSNDFINTIKLPTLAILGAGSCNDFDLEKLSSHFSKITLIDYDFPSMHKALSTYHLEQETDFIKPDLQTRKLQTAIIEQIPVSLNGLDHSDYRRFCEQLQHYVQNCPSAFCLEDFTEYALSLLEKDYKKSRKTPIPLSPASYDYIVCFGVHSQLQAMYSYIYHIFEVNLNNQSTTPIQKDFISNRFFHRLQEENLVFIPKFHDALLSSAKHGIFLGCELTNPNCDTPIEGAYQAITDIRKRNINLTESVILWPFCPARQITYEMLIQKITL